MNAAMTAIGWTLVDFVWQGALIGAAAAALLALMRQAAPSQRYLVACAALLACFCWPAWTLVERLAAPDSATGVQLLAGPGTLSGSTVANVGAVIESNIATIVLCWAVCAAALALRMSLGLMWIGRVSASRGRPDATLQQRLQQLADRFGVTRSVRVRIVDHLASPVTAGWLRPVVLVPASLVTGMPPDLLDALLAHEMAHIKRLDYLVNLCQNVIETLLFYHPAVWWISNQARNEREKIADDLAAKGLGEPRRLALALSELEKIQFSHHHLAVAANGGDLMVRIRRLLKPETRTSSWKAALPVMALALVACFAQLPQLARAGAATTPAVNRPILDFRSCAKPQYPADSLRRNHTGTVTLAFDLNAQGEVTASRVTDSSGHAMLDEAARVALAKCSFRPEKQDGKPLASKVAVQYVWTLR